jgi:hypothetical protein
MIRIIHLVVVCAFVAAAAWVYKIKFDATVQAERIAVIRNEIKRERDTIASLRAEWSRLDSPPRIQDLAKRHLALKPLDATQYDTLDKLPERPKSIVPAGAGDPIAGIIENTDSEAPTGSIGAVDQQLVPQPADTQLLDSQQSGEQQ